MTSSKGRRTVWVIAAGIIIFLAAGAFYGLRSLARGRTFENVEIRDLKNWPAGTTLKIQKLVFRLTSLSTNGIYLDVENMRLKLPDADPIVVRGTLKQRQLDVNVYSRGFSIAEILSYFPDLKRSLPGKGTVRDIDFFVTGDYDEPAVNGNLTVEQFSHKGFVLTGVPLDFNVRAADLYGDAALHGFVHLKGGELKAKKAPVKLGEGYVRFDGPLDRPRLDIHGTARIEQTTIQIALKGRLPEPELTLTSEPPASREKLMIMLATGKSWRSVEDAAADGVLNKAALTKDFLGYFFFDETSNEFARRFGIRDFSVTLDRNQQGIAAKKTLGEKLEVGYGIEQTKTAGQPAAEVSQKLEGTYQLNDRMSVGVEREITTKQPAGLKAEEPVNEQNGKVLLKYKKSF